MANWPVPTAHNKSRCAEVSAQLELNGSKLFRKANSPVDVDVVEIGELGTELLYIETEEALGSHFTKVRSEVVPSEVINDDDGTRGMLSRRTRYYLLEPAYGRAELPLTIPGAYDLLSALNIFPEIYRYIGAFGRKEFSQDERFSGFDMTYTLSQDGLVTRFELSYLLKYVEKRQESRPGTDPWSVRHALIYQQVDVDRARDNHLLIRLPEIAQFRLEEELTNGDLNQAFQFVKNWTKLHSLCFDSVDTDLRQYINYIDEEVTKVFKRLVLSGIEIGKHNEYDAPQSSAMDMKTLQHLEDQANRVISVIELNMETLGCMMLRAAELEKRGFMPNLMLEDFRQEMEKIKQQHRFSLLNISGVVRRAKTVSEQLRDTVALRNSELANNHTKAIYQLTEASGQEARVVKTLTVLALFFLPASLVADFLQMGYVKLRDDGEPGWVAEPSLQIYASLVLPLIIFIVLVYGAVEWKSRKRQFGAGSGEGAVGV